MLTPGGICAVYREAVEATGQAVDAQAVGEADWKKVLKGIREKLPQGKDEPALEYEAKVETWVQYVVRVRCPEDGAKKHLMCIEKPMQYLLTPFRNFWSLRKGAILNAVSDEDREAVWTFEQASQASYDRVQADDKSCGPLLPTFMPWNRPKPEPFWESSVEYEDEDWY